MELSLLDQRLPGAAADWRGDPGHSGAESRVFAAGDYGLSQSGRDECPEQRRVPEPADRGRFYLEPKRAHDQVRSAGLLAADELSQLPAQQWNFQFQRA